MRLEIDALFERARREDPANWRALETLLHRMPEMARHADAEGDIAPDAWVGLQVEVLNRMNIPLEHGGLALTATALRRAAVFERVGRICPAIPIGMPGPGLSTPPVNSLGTPAQKREFFQRFLGRSQPVWGAFAITEPQGGSDATHMRTTARRAGDGDYVIEGHKCFITCGRRAEAVVVFATIDPAKGRFGVRAFVVDKGTPGFNVDRCEDMMGLRASQLAALSFVECRVPAERMLGHTGVRGPLIDAFTGAQNAWDFMRPALAAGINGACAGMLDHAVELAGSDDALMSRRDVQGVLAGLHEFRSRLDAARLLALRAAWKYDRGERMSTDASMAKAFSSTLAMRIAESLASWFPHHAARRGDRFDKFCRDAKAFDILEGTGDMQRLMLARAFEPATP